jgi:hypothetical protein
MLCFTHRDTQALGVCKTCGKAVCSACLRQVEGGIVCSEACENEHRLMREMNHRAFKIYGIGTKQRGLPNTVIAPLLMGTGFALGAALLGVTDEHNMPIVLFFLLMSSLMWLGAFLAWRKYRENGINV